MKFNIDSKIPGAPNFTFAEFVYLSRWNIHVFPSDEQIINIISIAQKLQAIRNFYGKPIKITSGLRPDKYNQLIGGSSVSGHLNGSAVDFVVSGVISGNVREDLEPKLEELQIRMEDLPGASWVHIDHKPVVTSRYFKP